MTVVAVLSHNPGLALGMAADAAPAKPMSRNIDASDNRRMIDPYRT
jgi:hypothetical protein